ASPSWATDPAPARPHRRGRGRQTPRRHDSRKTNTVEGVSHIAYFGPSGTFTEMALADLESAHVIAGPVERVAAPSPPAALEMVRSGAVEGAVVPFESSIEGSISTTLDALALGSRLQIVAETEITVAFEILVAT